MAGKTNYDKGSMLIISAAANKVSTVMYASMGEPTSNKYDYDDDADVVQGREHLKYGTRTGFKYKQSMKLMIPIRPNTSWVIPPAIIAWTMDGGGGGGWAMYCLPPNFTVCSNLGLRVHPPPPSRRENNVKKILRSICISWNFLVST